MTRDLILEKNGPFSVSGGVLVPGDVYAYRIAIDMGTDTKDMTAMAVCQETGEYSADYECAGNRIFVTLSGSMYTSEGYITVRLAVSDDLSVLTAKEIIFRVVSPNNAETLAQTEGGTISQILTAVKIAETAAKNKMGFVRRVNDYDNLPVVKNNGDVCLIENAYSVPVYKRRLEKISFYGIGMESGAYAMLTLDNSDGIETDHLFTVYDENLQIICYASATSVSGNTLTISQSEFFDKLMDMANQITPDLYSEISLDKPVFLSGSSFTGDGDSRIHYPSECCVMYADQNWINLGGRIDLSDYATKNEVSELAKTTIVLSNTMSKDEIVSAIHTANPGTVFDIQTRLDLYDVDINFPDSSVIYSSTSGQKSINFGYSDIGIDNIWKAQWHLRFGKFSRISDINIYFSDNATENVGVEFNEGCTVANCTFYGYFPFTWGENCTFVNCSLDYYFYDLSKGGSYINCSLGYSQGEGINFHNVYLADCSCGEFKANSDNSAELLSKIKALNPDMRLVDAEGNEIKAMYATKDDIGNIETALDTIIAVQNELIGGDAV